MKHWIEMSCFRLQMLLRKYHSMHKANYFIESAVVCWITTFFGLIGVCFEVATSNGEIVFAIDLLFSFAIGICLAYIPFVLVEETNLYRFLSKHKNLRLVLQKKGTINHKPFFWGKVISISSISVLAAFACNKENYAEQISFIVFLTLMFLSMLFSITRIANAKNNIF